MPAEAGSTPGSRSVGLLYCDVPKLGWLAAGRLLMSRQHCVHIEGGMTASGAEQVTMHLCVAGHPGDRLCRHLLQGPLSCV